MSVITIKKRRNPDDDWGAQGSHVCEDCGHDEIAIVYEGSDGGWYCEDCIYKHLPTLPLDENSTEKCRDCGDSSDEELYEGHSIKWDRETQRFVYTPHWYCRSCVKEHIDRDEDEFETEVF